MGHLIDGVWHSEDRFPTDDKGAFVRKSSSFRQSVRADGSSEFAPAAGRYHLFVAYACPWAHRTLIARALLGLEDAISVSVAHPLMLEQGWVFDHAGFGALHEVYAKSQPDYTGRATVPVLWDTQTGRIVNNESRDVLRMLTTEFREFWTRPVELAPAGLVAEIDEMAASFYNAINNGVYRAGFARTQGAYENAVTEVFEGLDRLEKHLSNRRFLVGGQLTETDICLFTTLVRFDPVYVTHFKCNVRRLVDYPNLWGYTRDIYQLDGVAPTVHFDHIKQHYFRSHASVNPSGVVPLGPQIDFDAPHTRASLGS